jgi:type IV pilus assembly protein PilC
MPKFAFTALDLAGDTVKGVEAADSLGEAHAAISARELHPVSVKELKSILQLEITKKKLKRKDLMHFSRQLAVFVRAGIPILEGLKTIQEEASSKVLAEVLDDMVLQLQAGETFANSAAAHPHAFPSFYISVLRSAELTGNLDIVLDQLAEYIERDVDARQKVSSALVYPAVIFVMAIVTAVVLTIFVIPRFETFFESLDAELPLITRMLLSVSSFMGDYGLFLGVGLVAAVAGAAAYYRTTGGRAVYDKVVLKVPGLGPVIREAILERFCRVLASMVTAGVPLPNALAVTADVTNNDVYRRGLVQAREAMLRGEGLARPLAATKLFPGAARQMFRVGEETGTLDEQLVTAAAYFDRELEYKIKRFTALFEPAVIIFMGLIVGFVAIAMVSAMYGIFNQVNTV